MILQRLYRGLVWDTAHYDKTAGHLSAHPAVILSYDRIKDPLTSGAVIWVLLLVSMLCHKYDILVFVYQRIKRCFGKLYAIQL